LKGNFLYGLMFGVLLCACTKGAESGRSVSAPHAQRTAQPSEAPAEIPLRFRSFALEDASVASPSEDSPVDDFSGTVGITELKHDERVRTLQRVRLGKHPLYDRAVFEFEVGLPGYKLEYIDQPVRQCGSGEVVAMPGDAWLAIRFFPAAAHTKDGKPTLEARELQASLTNLLELKQTCDFEAVVTWVLAVSSPEHYQVFELSDPPRVVVDVHH
jgi:hypothetical protein